MFDKDWVDERKKVLRESFSGDKNPLYKDISERQIFQLCLENPTFKLDEIAKAMHCSLPTILNKIKKATNLRYNKWREVNNLPIIKRKKK